MSEAASSNLATRSNFFLARVAKLVKAQLCKSCHREFESHHALLLCGDGAREAHTAHNRKITVRNSRLRYMGKSKIRGRRLSPTVKDFLSQCSLKSFIRGVRQEVKPLDLQSSYRRFESCTPYQSWMVNVAQLVERESVALVGAGSSPVIHPEILRSHSSVWSEHPVVNRKITGSNPVGSAKIKVTKQAIAASLVAGKVPVNGSVAQLVRAADS
jgi:hypothetical protein